jgi:tRNA1(Val) A37 N6-methylase TrmN6
MPAIPSQTSGEVRSRDRFLGGRVEIFQPGSGNHRAGLEAVLLGAAASGDFAGLALDLGSGAGVAGMCLAARAPAARVTLVEREPELVELARESLALAANASIAGRVEAVEAVIGKGSLAVPPADLAVMNPPFHRAGKVSAPGGGARARAHLLGEAGLEAWFRAAAGALRPDGELIGIFRADALALVVEAAGTRFGRLELLPIHPRPGENAHRLMLRGRKGSRATPSILPGLVLHPEEGNGFRPAIDAILRDGAGLETACPAWRGH